jgi:hypothetical protein
MVNQGSRKGSTSQCFSQSLCNFSKLVIRGRSRAVIGISVLVFGDVVGVGRGQQ